MFIEYHRMILCLCLLLWPWWKNTISNQMQLWCSCQGEKPWKTARVYGAALSAVSTRILSISPSKHRPRRMQYSIFYIIVLYSIIQYPLFRLLRLFWLFWLFPYCSMTPHFPDALRHMRLEETVAERLGEAVRSRRSPCLLLRNCPIALRDGWEFHGMSSYFTTFTSVNKLSVPFANTCSRSMASLESPLAAGAHSKFHCLSKDVQRV